MPDLSIRYPADLCKAARQHPENADELFAQHRQVLNDGYIDSSVLKSLCECFPNQHATLYRCYFNKAYAATVQLSDTSRAYAVRYLFEAFPEKTYAIATKLGMQRHQDACVELTILFATQNATVKLQLVRFVNEYVADYVSLIKYASGLARLCEIVPEVRAVFAKYLLANQAELHRIVTSPIELDKLIAVCPAFREQLLTVGIFAPGVLKVIAQSSIYPYLVKLDAYPNFPRRQFLLAVGIKSYNEFEEYVVANCGLHEASTYTSLLGWICEFLSVDSATKANCLCLIEQLAVAMKKSNESLTPHQRIKINDFCFEHLQAILNLFFAIGPTPALQLLIFIAGKSVLQLNRFMMMYSMIKDRRYLDSLQRVFDKFPQLQINHDKSELLGDFLVAFGNLMRVTHVGEAAIERFDLMIANATTIEDAQRGLNKDLLEYFLNRLNVSCGDVVDDQKIQRFVNLPYFKMLISARETLGNIYGSGYLEVLNDMLRCDLGLDRFSTLFDPSNEQGAGDIARHNHNVESALTAAGINAGLAIHYRRQHRFVAFKKNVTHFDFQQAGTNIIACLQRLLAALNALDIPNHERKRRLVHVKKLTERMLVQLTKGKDYQSNLARRMKSPAFVAPVKRIKTGLVALGDDFASHKQALDPELAGVEQAQQKQVAASFRVQQWDKGDPRTLFLGNYLDCCLATDGIYFKAMVERRLDAGMPFHVVTDEATGEPVCGLWLFFAFNAKTNQVELAANFVNLSNKYNAPKLKETIVANLLHFTGEMYIPDTGVSRFIFREPNEGVTKFMFSRFSRTECQFTRQIGGGFTSRDYGCQMRYYLIGLRHRHMFHYTAAALKKQFPNVTINPGSIASSELTTFSSSSTRSVAIARGPQGDMATQPSYLVQS